MDYKVHKSELIVKHQSEFIDLINTSYNLHQRIFNEDSTWSYYKYNFFSLSAPSLLSYKLFVELKKSYQRVYPKR